MNAKMQLNKPPAKLIKSISSIPVTEIPKQIEIKIPLKMTSLQ